MYFVCLVRFVRISEHDGSMPKGLFPKKASNQIFTEFRSVKVQGQTKRQMLHKTHFGTGQTALSWKKQKYSFFFFGWGGPQTQRTKLRKIFQAIRSASGGLAASSCGAICHTGFETPNCGTRVAKGNDKNDPEHSLHVDQKRGKREKGKKGLSTETWKKGLAPSSQKPSVGFPRRSTP